MFIVVCNNTATSKLVYDYVVGLRARQRDRQAPRLENGRLKLFRNYDEHGQKLARPRTLLIDSEQLESGEALDPGFRDIEADDDRALPPRDHASAPATAPRPTSSPTPTCCAR